MSRPFLATFALVCGPVAAAFAQADRIDFNRDIRPILSDNCFKCHGPDEKQRQAGLRLDTPEGATASLPSGFRAIVPGKSAASALVKRITSGSRERRMPPADSGRALSPQQIDLFKKWIDQGGRYQGHWSLIRPSRADPPPVKDAGFARNWIDRFVLARLEAEGLRPSAAADRITLIRRVTLDLTGLPPTPEEVDAFLADKSADAYEKLVDRLLASPRYGEHMARYWLDLARYGDTHGLHLDNERSLWKYRDWVIAAFNANMPFDRFTVEQLAGDLLPGATLEQRIATGFVRCNVTTSEGGSINEEVLVRYAVDRTETLGTVFMGMTLGCAVCHDHKFDPISQKDFYRLYAFFNAAADAAMDGNVSGPPPILRMPSPEQEAALKSYDERIAAARKKIADALTRVDYKDPGPGKAAATQAKAGEFVWIDDAAPRGAQLQGNTPWEFVSAPDHPVHAGKKSMRRQAAGVSQHYFEKADASLKVGEGDKLFAYVYLDPKDPPATVMLQFNDGNWEHRAFWGEDRIPFGSDDTPGHRKMGPLPKAGQWTRLEVDAGHVGLAAGSAINGWAFTQHGGTVYWDKAGIVTRTPQTGPTPPRRFESLAEWEGFESKQAKSKAPQNVRDALKVKVEKRNDQQKKVIRDYFLQAVYPGTRAVFDPLTKEVDSLEKQRKDVDLAVPVSMVMADLPAPRPTHVLIRGQYNKKGEKVTYGTPAVLPPLPTNAPGNRLGLARWLTDPAHPLTARVTVNRFWQQFFGRGIVRTSEDFGSQGEWPSHPALLDRLAVEFVESGWDVKKLMRLIATSATYRQSSAVTAELVRRDPENILLARGPRFRLDAEAVRDSALFISGLLVERIGGKGVKPYQPSGLWEAVGFVGSNTREFKRDTGEALWRRSLYTFWKRTAPPPGMMALDAPSRENCTARRARTNTPLQALLLMNDEQYVEAARRLAERMVSAGHTPADRIAAGFRLATARRPESAELDVMVKVYERQLARFRSSTAEATRLLSVGEARRNTALDPAEHAAMTMVANLILNLDEVITKE
jgi:hypothetical protein